MITRDIVNRIYKKYKKGPKSADMLDMAVLFDGAREHHKVHIDPEANELRINSLDPTSPFHSIRLGNIHAIVPFKEWVAIVMHASIIFLNRTSPKVAVDVKRVKPTLWDRLQGITAE